MEASSKTILLCSISILLMKSTANAANSCYVCPPTTIPFLCFAADCGVESSCFTQAWIEGGQTYYQRGCLESTILGDCEMLSRYFCTNTNVFHCCTGNDCNNFDPLVNWVPRTPTNVIPYIRETSIELTWEPTCFGDYRYEIEYAKLVGGTTAGQYHSTITTYANTFDIHSLNPGTSYLFRLKAYHGGVASQAKTVVATTLLSAPVGPTVAFGAKCWKTDRYFGAPNTLHTCPNSDDWCFTQAEYLANTSERLTSRGCMSGEECGTHINSNFEKCKPGQIGAVCNFCCRGEHCNTVEWTYSGLVCDNIPVDERILCGWSGIAIADCIQRGCCYLPSNDTVAWCHHGKYPTTVTPTSPPVAQAQALSTWMIVLIVLVILCIIVIIIVIVRCCVKRKRKRQSGSYDIYAIPKPRNERRPRITTVSRESYDNMVISD